MNLTNTNTKEKTPVTAAIGARTETTRVDIFLLLYYSRLKQRSPSCHHDQGNISVIYDNKSDEIMRGDNEQ